VSKERVAFDEAMRLLRWQDGRLTSMRATALGIVSVGGLALTLAVTAGVTSQWLWGAAVAIGVAVALAIWLHWPMKLGDAFYVSKLLADYVDDAELGEDVMLRDLAVHADTLFNGNVRRLRVRQFGLLGVLVALAVEVGAIAAAAL
jgi:hypothetical protein